MTLLPPGVMGEGSVGWWHWDTALEGTGGVARMQNRIVRPNASVLGIGSLSQPDTALRPSRSGSVLTFADDYLASYSGLILPAGSLPQLWVVCSHSDSPNYTAPGVFSAHFGTALQIPGNLGLDVWYDQGDKQVKAACRLTSGATSVSSPESISSTSLVVVKASPITLTVEVNGVSATGSSPGDVDEDEGPGLSYGADYVYLGAWDRPGEGERILTPWTGTIREAFLSRANATVAQEAMMKQYFKSLYPELPL